MDVRNSIYNQVRELFLRETEKKVEEANRVLHGLRDGQCREDVEKLWRILSSLKGTGATAGFPKVSRIAAKVEKELNRYREGFSIPGEDVLDYAAQGLSIIGEFLHSEGQAQGPERLEGTQGMAGKSILVVDDDGVMLSIMALALEKAGCEVRLARDLATARRLLGEKIPDLLILDVVLGDESGLGFCAELKASRIFSAIPILFLSALDGRNNQVECLGCGGEDFIPKPFDIVILLARIGKILARVDAMKDQDLYDPLTGTYCRRYFQERLAEEAARWQRKRRAFAVALLEIDGFRDLRQFHGQAFGEEVLRSFGRFFRKKLRRTDVTARYEGEVFALLLPETSGDVARMILQRLKGKWADTSFSSPLTRQPVTVSFSCGIAAFPEHAGNEGSLIRMAEQGLEAARQQGGDRIQLISPGSCKRSVDQRLILVADEDVVIRRMIQDHFTVQGFQVLTAENGEEAWDYLQIHRPHLVIIDYWISRFNALQFLTRMKNHGLCEDTGIVVTLEKVPEDGLNKLIKMGIHGAVAVKPFSVDELNRKVLALRDSGPDQTPLNSVGSS